MRENLRIFHWLSAHFCRAAFITIASILCAGCIIGDRVGKTVNLIVSQKDGTIYFDYPRTAFEENVPGTNASRSRVVTSSIGLVRVNGSNEEVFWLLDIDTTKKNYPPIQFPLRYGEKFTSMMEKVSAKRLIPGAYKMGFLFGTDGETHWDTAVAEFTIDRNLKLSPQNQP